MYNSTTLVCRGDINSSAITWQYSINADLSSSEMLATTYMSTQTGVSWIALNNSKQGYYQCIISKRYTIGVFNTKKTTGISYIKLRWFVFLCLSGID